MPAVPHASGFFRPSHNALTKTLALLLCVVLVFSPWIFIPTVSGLWAGSAWAAPISITGGTVTTRQDAGADNITIQGGANVTINGSAGEANGGALFTNGSITLSNATLNMSDNVVTANGSAIYARGTVTLSGVNATFANNTATFVSTNSNSGSVIYSQSDIILSNSNINFTSNNGPNGTINTVGDVAIRNSTVLFQSNSAPNGPAAISGHEVRIESSNVTFDNSNSRTFGGNIRNSGPLVIDKSTVKFYNSRSEGCSAFHTEGLVAFIDSTVEVENNTAADWGGGFHAASNMNIRNTTLTLTNNTSGTEGGGIHVSGSDVANFTDSTVQFIKNKGNLGGGINTAGGVNFLRGTTTFTQNTATTQGGGLLASGTVTITDADATFTNNNATVFGGGLYSSGTVKYNASKISFDDNKAGTGAGFHVQSGGLQIAGSNITMTNNSATTTGGGFNVQAGNAIFTNSHATFISNKVIGATGTGGGFAISGGSATFNTTTAHFTNNTAYKGGGFHTDGTLTLAGATLAFTGNEATIGGGFNVGTGSANFNNTSATFTANKAVGVGGAGGGFNVDSGNANFVDSNATFTRNTSEKGGGFSVGTGTVTVSGTGIVSFTENSATQGGGLWSGGNVNLAGATKVFNNTATAGGGIYASNSAVSFSGAASISGNNATEGGGIFASGTVTLTGAGTAAVSGNNATEGGGIYAAGTVNLAGANAQFADNTATRGGGIFTKDGSSVNMVGNATFINNSATESGGGLHAAENASITGGAGGFIAFVDNKATGSGGGIFANDSVNISGTGGEFRGNIATDGGAIWAKNSVNLAPAAGQVLTFATATDNIHLNNLTSKLSIGGDGVTVFHSTNNHVPGGVDISKGRTELRTASVFDNTPMLVTDSTLYMGNDVYAPDLNRVSNLTVKPKVLNVQGNTVGSGAAAPYATALNGFHLANNAVLALEMNHAGNAPIPYFTLNNSKATTGSNTRLHGVIGTTLSGQTDFSHTYVVFSGSSGTIDDFTPAHYSTSHLLVSLSDPVYDAATGTFAIQLVRGNPPPPVPDPPVPPVPDPPVPPVPDPPVPPVPDPPVPPVPDPPVPPVPDPPVPPVPDPPVPPVPDPPVPPVPDPPVPPVPDPPVPPVPDPPANDIFIALPDDQLQNEVRQLLVRDYLYNGPDQNDTLVGTNTLLDTLYYVKPDGTPLLTTEERAKALASAIYMGVFTGARQIMSETGTSLRSMLLAPKSFRTSGGAVASLSGNPAGSSEDASGTPPAMPRSGGTLWALPFYSREAMRGGSLANGIAADYDLQTYGAAVGSDVTFGNGKYTLGGLLAAGRGSIQAGGSLFDTQNDADFVGGMVSMRWRPAEELELSAYGGLLHQKNAVRQNNIFGLTTNFDSTLYQAGINARYEQPVGNKGKRVASIEIGGDVQRFRQEGLDFKAAGQDVAHMGSAGTTTVFVPVTLGLRDTLTFDNNSTLTLEGHLGYRLALGDRALRGQWRIPGGDHVVNVLDPKTDQHTGTAGLGLTWENGPVSLRVGYDLEMSRRYKSHMLMGRFLWQF